MMGREEMGVIVFGHTRAQHLQVLLESLFRQEVDCPVGASGTRLPINPFVVGGDPRQDS